MSKIATLNLFNLLLPFKIKFHLYLWEFFFLENEFDLIIRVRSGGTYHTVLILSSFFKHVKFVFSTEQLGPSKSTCMPNRAL